MNTFTRYSVFLLLFAGLSVPVRAGNPKGFKDFFKKKETVAETAAPSAVTAHFNLGKSFHIVASHEDKEGMQAARKIDAFLQTKGVHAEVTNVKARRNIIVQQVQSIPTVAPEIQDAYLVEVSKNQVLVRFTSPLSAVWAYNAFVSLYGQRDNVLSKITKKNKNYLKGDRLIATQGEEGDSDVVDFTKQEGADVARAKAVIDQCKKNDILSVYLVFVSGQGWKVESDVMKLVNPFDNLCASGGFDYRSVNEIGDYAADNGVTVIPVFDFVSEDNPCFLQFTGHPVHSVEGLRFSRAFLDEFCKRTSFETVSLGRKVDDEEIRRKYVVPLVEVLEKHGRKAVLY